MKKIISTSLCTLMIATSANAIDISPYASLKLGYTFNGKVAESDGFIWTDDLSGFTGSIAGGAAFVTHDLVTVRGELEYSYLSLEGTNKLNSERKAEMGLHTLMTNIFVDLGGDRLAGFKPYVGAGLGWALGTEVKYSGGSTGWNKLHLDGGLAYAFMFGVGYEVMPRLTLDLGAKYFTASMNPTKNAYWDGFDIIFTNRKGTMTNWSFLLGARYAF